MSLELLRNTTDAGVTRANRMDTKEVPAEQMYECTSHLTPHFSHSHDNNFIDHYCKI